MNTLRRFLGTIVDACKPSTYRPHLKKPTSRALGYLFWLLVCLGTITAVIFAALYIPARVGIRTFIDQSEPAIREFFPAGLVLTFESGSLSTNVDEPYVIDPTLWTTLRAQGETEDMPTHFITIDTDASIDDFDVYDTAVLLTRTHIVGEDSNHLRAYAFSEIDEDLVLDKKTYDAFAGAVIPYINELPVWIDVAVIVGLLLLPFVGAGFAWVWYLCILLVWTLILWAISGMMGKKLTYSQLYRLGLYGVTLPILYKTLIGWIPGMGWPLVPTLIFFVFMIVVLKRIPSPTMNGPKPMKKAVKAPKKAK